ncbi:MAG: ATP-binding cassette domain-containing protein [Spirochaetaceae bacterium]|jgi:alpha-D-ribose 1-methylphosphonate 5-triphosphate synthase subunit PhnL|nr:ATP-binding cassette domain-containing protein [Spirochaetaceae bacterium]
MLYLKNVSKTFVMHIRGGLEIQSFEKVSFETYAGSLLALTGPSGIGKSSLLKCVYRSYLPSSGQILYTTSRGDTVDLATAGDWEILRLRHREIAYVSQFFHVMPRVSALEILMEPLIIRGVSRREALDRSKEMLSKAGLGKNLWEMYPATFSGGEKQRLNILHAIISKPRLLLLDEPTASLDRTYKERIMEMILSLKAAGTAMVGVFHDRDALLALSDRRYDLAFGGYCPVDKSAEAELVKIESELKNKPVEIKETGDPLHEKREPGHGA